MEYKISEYKFVDDSGAAMLREKVVVEKIMWLLNHNKYDSLERFIEANQDFDEFTRKFNFNNAIGHFGIPSKSEMSEKYKQMLESLRTLTKDKQSISTENLETTRFGPTEEYVTYEGEDKTYRLDNSENKAIEEQLQDKQTEDRDFQTDDPEKNTENIMKDLEEREKNSLNLHYLTDITKELLNDEERLRYDVAVSYQIDKEDTIMLDVERGIIVNSEGKMLKIVKEDGVIKIIDGEEPIKTYETEEDIIGPQLVKVA